MWTCFRDGGYKGDRIIQHNPSAYSGCLIYSIDCHWSVDPYSVSPGTVNPSDTFHRVGGKSFVSTVGCPEPDRIFDFGIDRAPRICRRRRTVHPLVSFFRIFNRLSCCCRLDFMEGPPTRLLSLFLPAIGYTSVGTHAFAFHWECLVVPVYKTDSTVTPVTNHSDKRGIPDFCTRRMRKGCIVCMVCSCTLLSILIFIIVLTTI
jgi:hypothetical protein